jgi:aryl-alcohol dehydrogenase-like predicted oxidoreductase
MVNRRQWMELAAGAGLTLALPPGLAIAAGNRALMHRPIPSSGELVPVVGLGSSATFREVAQSEDFTALREVLAAMVEQGATVFDTAPGYGASEAVAGTIARDLGITEKIFWATKVNVASRGGGSADPATARAQIDVSFRRFGVETMDLIQVHNLGDIPMQLGILQQLQKARRIRYVGVTSTSKRQYPQLERIMREEPLDFIGVDYAVDNRDVEETILPLAEERKIAVMVYVPFGRTRLFQRVGDRPLPDWAGEFDATSWAQFFIKYVLAHPAVTVVTPATARVKHMIDNIGGGIGRLPDVAARRRMVAFIDALPAAG